MSDDALAPERTAGLRQEVEDALVAAYAEREREARLYYMSLLAICLGGWVPLAVHLPITVTPIALPALLLAIGAAWRQSRKLAARHLLREVDDLRNGRLLRPLQIIRRAHRGERLQQVVGSAIASTLRIAARARCSLDRTETRSLRRELESASADSDPELIAATLDYLSAVGDTRLLWRIDELSRPPHRPEVREAAMQCALQMRALIEHAELSGTLLRPAEEPTGDTLLRPSEPADDEQLLRPRDAPDTQPPAGTPATHVE